MNKLEAVAASKTFRKKLDDILQEMKEHLKKMIRDTRISELLDDPKSEKDSEGYCVLFYDNKDSCDEAIAQHTLSIRDLESAIMRQGMTLKYVGNPDPYPQSRNPESPVVEPTADGLKL